jgi:5-methylthioadenosine/S-adenosylhomocysteine deaminase
MSGPCKSNSTIPESSHAYCGNARDTVRDRTSRRAFLKSSALLASAGAASHLAVGRAHAQANAADAADLLALQQGPRRILLRGGVVLTLDPRIGDFAKADVLIEDGKIRDVRPDIAISTEATAVVDSTNRIVVPGFIDTHHHFYQGILRNILSNGLLNPDYNRDISNTLTAVYQPSDVYAGTLVSALGMVDMGTTTAVDTSQVQHSPEHTDASIRALQESGLRVVYAYSRGAGAAAQYPQDIVRVGKTYFNSPNQLLTLALGGGLDAKIFSYAREVGVRTVSHGVNAGTERTLMELGRAGLLKPGDEYIHCNYLSGAAWRLIKDSGGRVSLAVPIEMAMGHGVPPIQEALDHGVRPSLSSDVDVTMAQDPFTVMRSAFTLQRMLLLQRARNGEQNLPKLLTCRDVLEFATIEGARCADLDSKIGTLTPGKEADIVLLAADRLNVWPLNNAPGCVVNLMNPSNVDTVFIAGQVMKWRGNLVGVDTPRVLRLAETARDGVIRRAGFQANLLG